MRRKSGARPPSLNDVDWSLKLEPAVYDKKLAQVQLTLTAIQQAYLSSGRSAVIVFEGWDAAGKGGTIRRTSAALDPRSFKVWPIGPPRNYYLARLYLLRFMERLPPAGAITAFDRSWYGRVLVERVEKLIPTRRWKAAYREITEFERMMTDDGTGLVKLFFHITPEEDGLLRDKTRPSRVPPLGPEVAERVVALTLTDPPAETTHWTAAMMAKAAGISVSSVQRIWRAHGLQPHRVRQFKLSNDPRFVEKLRDVVGLYLDPPAHAIVLSVDEKSQIQALDRTQPGLPMKKGRAGTMTHDYKRHGTTTLFAALNVLDGTVIGRNMQRHRHQEFIRFLNAIEAAVPTGSQVHAILDNYAAHKHPKVRAWLDRHPRWTFHFVPTSCSWLNAVEGFFAKLSKRRLKRGAFHSIVDLQAAINRFVHEHNAEPSPFTWTADPDRIIAAVRRGHQVLDSIH